MLVTAITTHRVAAGHRFTLWIADRAVFRSRLCYPSRNKAVSVAWHVALYFG